MDPKKLILSARSALASGPPPKTWYFQRAMAEELAKLDADTATHADVVAAMERGARSAAMAEQN